MRMAVHFAPGDRLGAYVLEAPLGLGGFGTVWRARLASGAEPTSVVLKLASPRGVTALANEYDVLKAVKAPAIVPVLGNGLRHDPPYLVYADIGGVSLRERLAAGPLDAGHATGATAGRVLDRLATALAAIHAAGFVHGDVTPANVVLDGAGVAWLFDFGLARVYACAEETPANAPAYDNGTDMPVAPSTVAGTPAYLAPEVRLGASASPAADVYALGIICVELVTGRRPPAGEPLAQAMAAAPDWARTFAAGALAPLAERYAGGATARAALAHLRGGDATASATAGAGDPERERRAQLEAVRALAALIEAEPAEPAGGADDTALAATLTEPAERPLPSGFRARVSAVAPREVVPAVEWLSLPAVKAAVLLAAALLAATQPMLPTLLPPLVLAFVVPGIALCYALAGRRLRELVVMTSAVWTLALGALWFLVPLHAARVAALVWRAMGAAYPLLGAVLALAFVVWVCRRSVRPILRRLGVLLAFGSLAGMVALFHYLGGGAWRLL